MSKTIKVTASDMTYLDSEDLHNFQGELKMMTPEARNKLRRSILEEGFTSPIAYWNNAKINYILDGHQRLDVIKGLKKEGYEIPKLPAYEIKARDYNHAKKLLASFISQYGKITKEGFKEFFADIDFDLGEFEFPDIGDDFFQDLSDTDSSDEPFDSENPYSTTIEAPIYKPTGEKPQLDDLIDLTKYAEIMSKIERSDLDHRIQGFLKFAATRHIVFHYDKIAEFYAHENENIQDFFEDSALVIIDFNKAIEKGFVQLTTEIKDQYVDEYRNQEIPIDE